MASRSCQPGLSAGWILAIVSRAGTRSCRANRSRCIRTAPRWWPGRCGAGSTSGQVARISSSTGCWCGPATGCAPPTWPPRAACGHAVLTVAGQPAVAIIPTGNEILPVGQVPGPGQAVDSNSVMLAARAAEVGARSVVTAILPDDPAAIAGRVESMAAQADVVLVIAGSSAGRATIRAVVAKAGALVVRGVAVRPGHPVLLGYAGRRAGRVCVPVIGVPGYPLAAAVIFELFAVPLLADLEGLRPRDDRRLRVQLACDWTSSADVEDWVPVSLAPAPAGEHRAVTSWRCRAGEAPPRSAGCSVPMPGGRSRSDRQPSRSASTSTSSRCPAHHLTGNSLSRNRRPRPSAAPGRGPPATRPVRGLPAIRGPAAGVSLPFPPAVPRGRPRGPAHRRSAARPACPPCGPRPWPG